MLMDVPSYSMRPSVNCVTKGVLSQIPGSAGGPSDAIVVPKDVLVCAVVGAVASARSASEVVSNCSAVVADAGGGGGGAGFSVGAAGTAGVPRSVPKRPCIEGDVHPANAASGSININLMT